MPPFVGVSFLRGRLICWWVFGSIEGLLSMAEFAWILWVFLYFGVFFIRDESMKSYSGCLGRKPPISWGGKCFLFPALAVE